MKKQNFDSLVQSLASIYVRAVRRLCICTYAIESASISQLMSEDSSIELMGSRKLTCVCQDPRSMYDNMRIIMTLLRYVFLQKHWLVQVDCEDTTSP